MAYVQNARGELHIVHEPNGSSAVDIVFVHGLSGDWKQTWTKGSTFWPQDLLPSDLPQARVMSFGFTTNVKDVWTHGQSSIDIIAKQLASSLIEYRWQFPTATPIVFIAHSLGGLLLQQMLVRCSQSKDVLEQGIFSLSTGIIFYGTPSIGINKPAWAGLLQKLYRVTNRVTGSYLRPSADFDELGLIQTSFFDLMRQRDSGRSPVHVHCIYESLPLPLIGTVVAQNTVLLPGQSSESSYANHMDMTKFESSSEPDYQRVASRLKLWLHSRSANASEVEADQKSQGRAGSEASVLNNEENELQTLMDRGKYLEAEAYQKEILQRARMAYSSADEHTLEAMRSLAWILYQQGKFEETKVLQIETLQMSNHIFGDQHHRTLRTILALVETLHQLGWSQKQVKLEKWYPSSETIHRLMEDEALTRQEKVAALSLVGRINDAIVLAEAAAESLKHVYGHRSLSSVEADELLARLHMETNRPQLAIPLYESALVRREELHGNSHPAHLQTASDLSDALHLNGEISSATDLAKLSLAGFTRIYGARHQRSLAASLQLSKMFVSAKKYAQAEELLLQSLERSRQAFGDNATISLRLALKLGESYMESKQLPQAKKVLRQTLSPAVTTLGGDHNLTRKIRGALQLLEKEEPDTHASPFGAVSKEQPAAMNDFSHRGAEFEMQGRYEEAEAMYERALEEKRKVLGEQHPDTLTCLSQLGVVFVEQGKYKEAERIHRQALREREKILGLQHLDTLTSLSQIGVVFERQGRYEEAEAIYRRALQVREQVLGVQHPDTLSNISQLGSVFVNQGKYKEAMEIHQLDLQRRQKAFGLDHLSTLHSLSNLGMVYRLQGMFEEAEAMYREAAQGYEIARGAEHPHTLWTVNNLAVALSEQGRYEKAVVIFRETLSRQEKVLGCEHPDTLQMMTHLAVALSEQGRYKEAETILRQSLALREKVLGLDHPSTLTSLYNLAHVLARQNRIDESSDMYQRACAGLDSVLGESHPTTVACHKDYEDLRARQREQQQQQHVRKLSRALAKLRIGSSKP